MEIEVRKQMSRGGGDWFKGAYKEIFWIENVPCFILGGYYVIVQNHSKLIEPSILRFAQFIVCKRYLNKKELR